MTSEAFIRFWQGENPFAAFQRLVAEFSGSAISNADTMHSLMRGAYWERKHLPAVVMLGTAGIQYCLERTREAADAVIKMELHSRAKGMAYDLASFTWPGWDERGICPTADQMALGLQATKFNLQMAIELQKPPEKVRNAHWLLGAQLLANISDGHVRQALKHFQQAVPAEEDEQYLLFKGYELLAQRILAEPTATAEWEAVMAVLAERGSESAKSFRRQLEGAARVFLK